MFMVALYSKGVDIYYTWVPAHDGAFEAINVISGRLKELGLYDRVDEIRIMLKRD